jgi:RNA polymerase sigma-70 factor (ECF subfamily)
MGAASVTNLDLPRLLQAAASGDEEAWRGIVQLYARRIYALARSRLCPDAPRRVGRGGVEFRSAVSGAFAHGHDAAEEVTQSVFVTIAAKLSTGQYTEQGRFESWLFRVAMNRIRDEVRRTRRQAAPTDPEVLDGAAARSDQADAAGDQLEALKRAVASLSESDREVIELRHHAGLSFKQMSDLLSEPLGTLLARHHRALRKLKDALTGEAGTRPTGTATTPGDQP